MKEYIENIIPRLKEFSQSLDRKETFVDVPWVLVDAEGGFQKYIFKRNGELVMSLNGVVTIGKWEYLAPAKSLLIDRVKDKILLNQNFVDSAIMVLNQDGIKNGNFVLANEILIPDFDVSKYLKELYYDKNNVKLKKLSSGEYLEVHDGRIYELLGAFVTIDCEPVTKNFLNVTQRTRYEIKDSKIIRVLVKQDFDSDKGKLTIELPKDTHRSQGDPVFINDIPAPDGKYRLGFMNHIEVQNGRIIKTSIF